MTTPHRPTPKTMQPTRITPPTINPMSLVFAVLAVGAADPDGSSAMIDAPVPMLLVVEVGQ
jgi:hypothetical protein